MTLFQRQVRLFWVRYIAPGKLENDPRFRHLLRRLTHQGLQVIGIITAVATLAYVVYRGLTGDLLTWNEDSSMWRPGATSVGSVQLWDKALLFMLGLALAGMGRWRIGLRRGRLAVAAFFAIVTWFIVLRNLEPGSFQMPAAWLTLLMTVVVGAVPFRPWHIALLGLAMTAEFALFIAITPTTGSDLPRLFFLLLVTAITTLTAAVLYASRYQQYRALRRADHLRDYSSARSLALTEALERERAIKDQLVQQEKLASLGQLTAGVAHEIKNPLNFINNFASLSRELAEEVREALHADPAQPVQVVLDDMGDTIDDLVLNAQKIAEHGWRADAIVRNMLQHARKTPGKHQPTDVNKLLDEYVGLAYHGMRARHRFDVEIERNYSEELEPLPLVAGELGRAFLNLFSNAFDALRARAEVAREDYTPTLRVSSRRSDEGGVAIYIGDNGGGMSQEVAQRVFEPFFTTKETGQGTGLGLSLTYEIITNTHGGSINVRSREGEGTVFSILLPPTPPDGANPEELVPEELPEKRSPDDLSLDGHDTTGANSTKGIWPT